MYSATLLVSGALTAPLLLPLPLITAFLPSPHPLFATKYHSTGTTGHPLKATPTDAINTLSTSQDATVATIAGAIPDLAPKPSLSWNGEMVNGAPAILDARDAPGPANVAWLGSVTVPGRMSSLTVFNGPLTDVPHLLSRCVINGDGASMTFDLDFRPRAYGAYELRDPEGNYPGPETFGRKAFEYSGNRKEYDTKFGTDELLQYFQSTFGSLEGATFSGRAFSDFEKLVNGPLILSVTVPLTDGNVAAVATARDTAAKFWLRWATEGTHDHRPGAPINSQYVYDTKYRQNAYSALLGIYSDIFGADGAKLAAAESGPLDEAYVGGGS